MTLFYVTNTTISLKWDSLTWATSSVLNAKACSHCSHGYFEGHFLVLWVAMEPFTTELHLGQISEFSRQSLLVFRWCCFKWSALENVFRHGGSHIKISPPASGGWQEFLWRAIPALLTRSPQLSHSAWNHEGGDRIIRPGVWTDWEQLLSDIKSNLKKTIIFGVRLFWDVGTKNWPFKPPKHQILWHYVRCNACREPSAEGTVLLCPLANDSDSWQKAVI